MSDSEDIPNAAAQVGVFGLGVMGRNLACNIARRGFDVVVCDRESKLIEEAVGVAVAAGEKVKGAASIEDFTRSLARPRRVVLLVKAGAPVDWTIEKLQPYLEPGDVLVDGGNSHYKDTERRQHDMRTGGLHLIGSGISGGERGALEGPSLMPGGDREAYELIRPVWESSAARGADGPCVAYLGPGGAGHFVKMVHNAIEYAVMQLIAEAYDCMRGPLGFDAPRIAQCFAEWNEGELESFLCEITSKIFRATDRETGRPLVDLVSDAAGQKGTGRWGVEAALELGVPVPTIYTAVAARQHSALKLERTQAAAVLAGPTPADSASIVERDLLEDLRHALYASIICAYAQGFALVRAGSVAHDWQIDLREVARVWQAGCIIRARLLREIRRAFSTSPELPNLLLDEELATRLAKAQESWRRAVARAASAGLPFAAMSASMGYYDTYRAAQLPLNLTQAQRDYFGAHTYERLDRPGVSVHTDWEELVG